METVISALLSFPPQIRKGISCLLAGAAALAMAWSVSAGQEPRPDSPVSPATPTPPAAAAESDRAAVSATLPKYSHSVEIAPYWVKVVIQENGGQILAILVISRARHTPAISPNQVMLEVDDSSGAKLKLTPLPKMSFVAEIGDAGGATVNQDYLIDRKAAGAAAEAEVTLLGKSARVKLFDHDPDARKTRY